jgi:2-C-methyl-D-erythritol 4-phosphate cytidylyltransferase
VSKIRTSKVWCIVPAAGTGSRMQSVVPKQYLPLKSAALIDFTLKRLKACDRISSIVVALDPNDDYWHKTISSAEDRVSTATGGNERADSVFNALQTLKNTTELNAKLNDWVLVHDAARPCICKADINELIDACLIENRGGLLATPMIDTVKSVTDNKVDKTVDRNGLWRALTPQLFKLSELEAALVSAKKSGFIVTDESSAIEHVGGHPLIIEGRVDNIKVTSPADLSLAEHIITQQEKEVCE